MNIDKTMLKISKKYSVSLQNIFLYFVPGINIWHLKLLRAGLPFREFSDLTIKKVIKQALINSKINPKINSNKLNDSLMKK